MPRNTNSRVWRFVKPFDSLDLLYGFQSAADDTLKNLLGQTDIAANTPLANLVIAPNNLKPYKLMKELATGTQQSFANYDKLATASQNKLKVVKAGYAPKRRKSNARGKIVFVTINSVKYGWKFLTTTLPVQLGTIGATEATGTEKDIVFGASFPRPPRMKFTSSTGEDTLTTFVDPSKVETASQAGWVLVDEGCYTEEHLLKFVG